MLLNLLAKILARQLPNTLGNFSMTTKRGPKTGNITRGSTVWHLSRLKAGQSILIPADSATMPQVVLTIRRAVKSGALADVFDVKTCYGHTSDLEDYPFKFYKITRVQ